tara:strand:- start:200 stop:403 length:204 start_codon:yes stop_codon:yes gene_type:complete
LVAQLILFTPTPYCIVSGDGEAKFWLEPYLELAKNHGYNRQQLKEIESLVEDHRDELVSAWKQHFSS